MYRTRVSSSSPPASNCACFGRLPAVAAHVEVPAVLRGDHADVLASRFGAFARATGDAELDLVRRSQTAVSHFEVHRHPHRILHAVPAPGRADTALHRAQRFTVGLPGLHPGVDEPFPDRGQLLDPGTEHVDALTAGHLDVQPEIPRDLPDDDELFGGALTTGHPRHHRVGAVLLDVGEEVVVGVLQRRLLTMQDVVGVGRREDRRDDGLADVATPSGAVACAISAEKVRICVARTISNSSARDCSKCSHSAFDIGTPELLRSCLTVGRHPPHVVPALVHALTCAMSHAPSAIAPQIAPLVTPLHEHTSASSGSAPAPGFSPAGEISAAGSPGSSRPTSGRNVPYADASPTRIPPSSVFASSDTTSFA